MKKSAKTLSRRIRRPNKFIDKIIKKRPYILPILGLFIGLLIVLVAVVARGGDIDSPSASHVVFLYDKGEIQTLDSRSDTVGELINKLPLKLIPQDVVEPSMDTPIVEDNFRINIYRARPVAVVDKTSKNITLTAQQSPRIVAENAGVKLNPEDVASFAEGDVKKNILGEQVIVKRAVPVFLNLYGKPISVRTQATTVDGLLREKQVLLDQHDKVQPALNTPITTNMRVYVTRSGVRLISKEEVAPIPTETAYDNRLTRGVTVLRQQGTAGKQVITIQVTVKNGKEVSRKVIQRVVTVPPVPRVVAVGTAALSVSLTKWLYILRMCESHGNYQSNTGNGFFGAYQFSYSTWNSLNTGYARADLAPPAVQDNGIIRNTLRSSGGLSSQNPGCYASTGLSNFPPSNR